MECAGRYVLGILLFVNGWLLQILLSFSHDKCIRFDMVEKCYFHLIHR